MSSEINFGKTVSQKLLSIIFYSSSKVFALSLSLFIAYLFKSPADLKTFFRALNPKS